MSSYVGVWLLYIVFSTPYYGGATIGEHSTEALCEEAAQLVRVQDNDNVTAFCVRK